VTVGIKLLCRVSEIALGPSEAEEEWAR